MESFATLRRRTTDLVQSLPNSLPQSLPTAKSSKSSIATVRGTWEKVNVPPLPRSSHSVDVVSGSAYIFGGEVIPRRPVNNDMHVVNLPMSISSSADSYPVKAAPPREYNVEDIPQAPVNDPVDAPQDVVESPKDAGDVQNDVEEVQKDLAEVSLDEDRPEGEPLLEGKGKERAPASEPTMRDVPTSRVGHATAVIGSRIFMFGGRGGPDMTPLEENGRVWVFDTRTHTWSYLDPRPAAAGIPPRFPPARSYHSAAAIDRPRNFAHRRDSRPETWKDWAMGDSAKVGIPQAPIVGNVAANAVDEEREGYGTFFIHAGCLANGDRASDLWAFNVRARVWSELPAAPGPARGGTAICVSKGKLFRFGGFDGTQELGGQVDFIHLASEIFDDQVSEGEVAVTTRRGWQTLTPVSQTTPTDTLDSDDWPSPRSVSCLLPLHIRGRDYLVLLMGESHPSGAGHEKAGKFHDDAWVFHVPSEAPARGIGAVRNAVWGALGKKGNTEGRWIKVLGEPYDDDSVETPVARGWIGASVIEDMDDPAVLVWGGVGEENQRLGDGWILRLG
ncbi:hypothetical protein VUR80DRAFT_853 [Thermomyces stellatus]